MYDALRRVVFQKQKCSLKGVGNISSFSYPADQEANFAKQNPNTGKRHGSEVQYSTKHIESSAQ